jgi:hypothetical protein
MAGHQMVYHWRHGWIPLTHAAALSKAKGNTALADRWVHGASWHDHVTRTRGKSAREIHSTFTGHNLTHLSDDSLTHLLGRADEHDAGHIVAELDRRDRVARQLAKRAAAREVKRSADHAAKDSEFDRRVNAGDDPESAYADVFGTSVTQQRRNTAIGTLRANGYNGRNFDQLSRDAFRDHVTQVQLDAEAATRGNLFKRDAGSLGYKARNVSKLFNGSEAFARANASHELLDYWQRHGRLTLADYQASLIGGSLRMRGTAAWH